MTKKDRRVHLNIYGVWFEAKQMMPLIRASVKEMDSRHFRFGLFILTEGVEGRQLVKKDCGWFWCPMSPMMVHWSFPLPSIFHYNYSRCNSSPFMTTLTTIEGSNQSLQARQKFTCSLANLVHCIQWCWCDLLYIGVSVLGSLHCQDDAGKNKGRYYILPCQQSDGMNIEFSSFRLPAPLLSISLCFRVNLQQFLSL